MRWRGATTATTQLELRHIDTLHISISSYQWVSEHDLVVRLQLASRIPLISKPQRVQLAPQRHTLSAEPHRFHSSSDAAHCS